MIGGPTRAVMLRDFKDKHILDTSAWNRFYDDPNRQSVIEGITTETILPTCVAISELAAIEDAERRLAILQLVKKLGKDNRPLATPNQLIILACQAYSRRDAMLTLNAGDDANGAWIALNKPVLIDATAQEISIKFNLEREDIFRNTNENLRASLQAVFKAGTTRPRSMGALIRQYAKNQDFVYEVVNTIYERAVGRSLPRHELQPLLNSLPYWQLFLMGYACAIYQRAVKADGYGHKNNPGHLDLWSATYLPSCDVFASADKRQRRALKILNGGNQRPARILSYDERSAAILNTGLATTIAAR